MGMRGPLVHTDFYPCLPVLHDNFRRRIRDTACQQKNGEEPGSERSHMKRHIDSLRTVHSLAASGRKIIVRMIFRPWVHGRLRLHSLVRALSTTMNALACDALEERLILLQRRLRQRIDFRRQHDRLPLLTIHIA